MKVTGSTIQQLDKSKPRNRCRDWRIWATTEEGRKSERFHGTYTQAQGRQKAFVAEFEELVPNAETFGAYAESWRLWREKSGNLDEQTVGNDKRNVSVLSRVLGDKRMDAITPEAVKSALLELKTGGERELSGTYMNNLFTALNNIMRTAADDGRIASNPCEKVKPPKTDTKERKALTASQMDGLWDAMLPHAESGDGRAMAMLLMLDAGLRPQEALALKPEEVDYGRKALHVRSAMKERSGNIGKTKRPSSVRDLPMTDRLADACAAYSRMRVGGKCFCENTRGGSPLRMQNVRRWWDANRDAFGAPGFVPYELRHSNLTKMARFMSVFDLQAWAGWSSIEPAKVYVHRDQSSLEAAVARSQLSATVLGAVPNAPKTHHNEKQARASSF
ncbi:MAG: tyrosine-type recombinase/integrase [Eggerthellaceae bacterium]|nr:tyrosine-type recombinase/integrase [Eggerthellaceae bacterium]